MAAALIVAAEMSKQSDGNRLSRLVASIPEIRITRLSGALALPGLVCMDIENMR